MLAKGDRRMENEKTTVIVTVELDDRQEIYELFADRERVVNLIRELRHSLLH